MLVGEHLQVLMMHLHDQYTLCILDTSIINNKQYIITLILTHPCLNTEISNRPITPPPPSIPLKGR